MSKKKKSGKKTALKVIGIILAVVVVFVGVYAALMAWTPAATTYSGEINPYITADAALVSAHRSGGGIMPENTMLAFESCMNSKDFNTDIFEFDLHITKDNKLILLHDDTLDRTTNAVEYFGYEDVKPIDHTYAELRELNFGDWEGLTYDEIVAKWPDALNNFFQHPDVLEIPHGESFPKLRERALDAVEKIVACHPEQTVAVFAHGAILRTILTAALHMDLKYVWTIRQFNTAVNIVTYTEHGTTVELLNGTGHLKYAQGTVD